MKCYVTFITPLRHGNRSWSRPLESMLVLGLYQHVSEPSQKRLSKAFIQRSVMPHQRLVKTAFIILNFLKKKKKEILYSFGTHASRTERPREPLHPYYLLICSFCCPSKPIVTIFSLLWEQKIRKKNSKMTRMTMTRMKRLVPPSSSQQQPYSLRQPMPLWPSQEWPLSQCQGCHLEATQVCFVIIQNTPFKM